MESEQAAKRIEPRPDGPIEERIDVLTRSMEHWQRERRAAFPAPGLTARTENRLAPPLKPSYFPRAGDRREVVVRVDPDFDENLARGFHVTALRHERPPTQLPDLIKCLLKIVIVWVHGKPRAPIHPDLFEHEVLICRSHGNLTNLMRSG